MTRRLSWALCPILVLAGCRASVSAKANTGGQADANANLQATGSDQEMVGFGDAESQTVSEAPYGQDSAAAPRTGPLLGARHDLTLKEGTPSSCRCLAVHLGQPGDPEFVWLDVAPSLDASTQLALALSSQGVACEGEPEDSLGASYWGYKWEGDDVVVLVEPARFGRPITTGAIIPKPLGEGQVYVEPQGAKTPYGQANNGQSRCLIGNPGAARATPRRDDEVPED